MPKKLKPESISELCEDLAQAARAATLPGNPMRWVVLSHFAERILALTEDHRRLRSLVDMKEKR